MDTTKIEYTAEDLISHKLQREGILVAKPKFDREGTDLLAFIEINDGVKFCRIQCKGRTLSKSGTSSVEIPCSYVTPGFILFLFIEIGNYSETNLFCFFSTDIRQWNARDSKYILGLNKSSLEKLDFYKFDSSIGLIKTLIHSAELSGSFHDLVYGRINVVLEDARCEAKAHFGK